MSSPQRVCSLTAVQKQAIVDERLRRITRKETSDQEALAQWAYKTFRLLRKPHQSTISRLLRSVNRPSLFTSPIHIRNRHGVCKELEVALLSWVNAQFSARRCINGGLIVTKAKRLQASMNELLPPEKHTHLVFSSGWLQNFQKRCNLQSLKSHGESGDADNSAFDKALPFLTRTIKGFDSNDVFNADEFGHYYAMAPDRTISSERLPGRKKAKVRLSYLACCNASGTERLPLMCIGSAMKPRCFNKKSGGELGFDYHANRKAWMTTALFFDWIMRFSSYITRSDPSRRVLLLLDNCSAHGTAESLPAVNNVEIMFLPPNTTSKLQPLDAGIIAATKTRYRKWQYERALDCIDAAVNNIYKVDQLTAMKALRRIWKNIPQSILHNCWKHTGLLGGEEGVNEGEEDIEGEVLGAIRELVPFRAQMAIAFVLNPDGEDDVIEETDESTLAAEAVASVLQDDNTEDGEEQEEASYLDSLSFRDRLHSVVVVRHMLESADVVDPLILNSLRSVQRDLKLTRAKSAKQTRMPEFFSKV